MLFISSILLAGAGFAAAQSTSLSSQCESTLVNVAASPDSACINPSGIISIGLSGSSSVIPSVNTWLSGMCSQSPCSNSTLQAIVTNVTAGCSAELSSSGVNTADPTALITAFQASYPTVRQVMCLKDTSTSTLCVSQLLTNVQAATTTLSITNIVTLITQWTSGLSSGIPSSAFCTNCTKAAYTILSQGLPSVASSAQSELSSQCGTNYTDGQMPPDIQETAGMSTTTTGGASTLSVSLLNLNMYAAVLAVSAAFAILA